MDIDTIFDDHNYAARRHGSLCICTGNTTSESDESEWEVEENREPFGKPRRCDDSNQEQTGFSKSCGRSRRSRHGPFCACDDLDSLPSCESSSEDEDVENGSTTKTIIANDSLSIAENSDVKEPKEVQDKNSNKEPSVHQNPQLFSYFDQLKWHKSLSCHGCYAPTQQLIAYCTSCFKKSQGQRSIDSL